MSIQVRVEVHSPGNPAGDHRGAVFQDGCHHAGEGPFPGCRVQELTVGEVLYLGRDPRGQADDDLLLPVYDPSVDRHDVEEGRVSGLAAKVWIDPVTLSVLVMNLSTVLDLELNEDLPHGVDSRRQVLFHCPETQQRLRRLQVAAAVAPSSRLRLSAGHDAVKVADVWIDIDDAVFDLEQELHVVDDGRKERLYKRDLRRRGTIVATDDLLQPDLADQLRDVEVQLQWLMAEDSARFEREISEAIGDRSRLVDSLQLLSDARVLACWAPEHRALLHAFLEKPLVQANLIEHDERLRSQWVQQTPAKKEDRVLLLADKPKKAVEYLRARPTEIPVYGFRLIEVGRGKPVPQSRRTDVIRKPLAERLGVNEAGAQRGGSGSDHAWLLRKLVHDLGFGREHVQEHLADVRVLPPQEIAEQRPGTDHDSPDLDVGYPAIE